MLLPPRFTLSRISLWFRLKFSSDSGFFGCRLTPTRISNVFYRLPSVFSSRSPPSIRSSQWYICWHGVLDGFGINWAEIIYLKIWFLPGSGPGTASPITGAAPLGILFLPTGRHSAHLSASLLLSVLPFSFSFLLSFCSLFSWFILSLLSTISSTLQATLKPHVKVSKFIRIC